VCGCLRLWLAIGPDKAVSVTDHGGPYGSDMSGLPHFLDSLQMAVRSALHANHPLLTGRFLVFIYVRGSFDPRITVGLEGLGQ
jgi:hypothetical protein